MIANKISLITVCYNAAGTIERCINSVARQRYMELEYIIIDGGSVDGTRELILKHKAEDHLFISERDEGMYDAINKGILRAKGDIIGLLHADDYFADDRVLTDIADVFASEDPDLLYADLDYVNKKGAIVRKWRSGQYVPGRFNRGWMPPHPTLYVKKKLFDDFGLYNTDYGTAADYELMLRFMHFNRAKVFYLNKVIVKMRSGGQSNRSLGNRMLAWKHDFNAMVCHRIPFPLLGIVLKPLRKISQFLCLS